MLHVIGEGAQAKVYKALREDDSSPVALKVFKSAAVGSSSERIINEYHILRKIQHPNIVSINGLTSYRDLFYVDMEYLSGGSLAQKIKEQLPIERLLEILIKIAAALAFAHDNRVVHRDVKPENILFRSNGEPVLSDFGIARTIEDRPATRAGLGTPVFESPEQIRGETPDERSDLYSIGIVFYEMLTGSVPYDGTIFDIEQQHLKAPIPKLPPEHTRFQRILERLVAKKPTDRFQTASELIAELEEAKADLAKEESRRRDIERALGQVRQYMEQGQLIEPEKSNAYEACLEILQQDARHQDANAMFGEIVQQVFAEAYEETDWSQRWDKLERLRAKLGLGLERVPEHEVLQRLQWDVQKKQRADIQELVVQAWQQRARSRFLEPSGDNAYDTFRYVLERDPTNREAQKGLVQVAKEALWKTLEEKQPQPRKEKLEGLLSRVRDDLALPGHAGLRAVFWRARVQRVRFTVQQAGNVLLTALLSLGIVVVVWRISDPKTLAERSDELSGLLQDLVVGPETPPVKSPILLAQAEQLLAQAEQLLAQAEQQMRNGAYLEAWETYGKVLEILPNDDEAIAGLVAAGQRALEQARRQTDRDRQQTSLEALAQGLQTAPNVEDLKTLKQKVQSELDRVRLLAQGEQQVRDKAYLEACDTYGKVLGIQPKNTVAITGLIAAGLGAFEQARRQTDRTGRQKLLVALDQSLQTAPNVEDLTTLKRKVQSELDRVRLLAQAEQQMRDKAYLEAWDTYAKVLEILPDDDEAIAGLVAAGLGAFEQARRQTDRIGQQTLLTALDRRLQTAPNVEALNTLKRKVESALVPTKPDGEPLLAQAKQQMRARKYLEAWDTYGKVLGFQANDTAAITGLVAAGQKAFEQARRQTDRTRRQTSLAALDRRLRKAPKVEALTTLKRKVQSELDRVRLLAQGEQQMRDRAYLKAWDTYGKVLGKLPNDDEAIAGLVAAGQRAFEQARRQTDRIRQQTLLAALDGRLQTAPKVEALTTLKQKVQTELVPRERLLAQAEQQMKALEYLQACNTYAKVLDDLPDDDEAIKGLTAATREVLKQARKEEQVEPKKRSLNALEGCLSAVPSGVKQPLMAKIEKARLKPFVSKPF